MAKNGYGFIFRTKHKYLFDALSNEQLGILWKKIIEYVEGGDSTNLCFQDDCIRISFLSIKEQIDEDRNKYNTVCTRNRNNGKGGGRPTAKPSDPEDTFG